MSSALPLLTAELIIIGAGPAGLFMGINTAASKKKIILLEKNALPGKKFLLSGSGQCNITHSGAITDFYSHYAKHQVSFLKSILSQFDNLALLDYFAKQGISFTTTDQGKIFPSSLKASQLLDFLIQSVRSSPNIELKLQSPVKKIIYQVENSTFQIFTPQCIYSAKSIALAAGGSSYPATGSSGDSYLFAADLGHSIIDVGPALTPVYVKNYPFASLSGISFPTLHLSLYRNKKKIHSHLGPILFTHQCLSGPGILDFSRYILPDDELVLHFILEDTSAWEQNLIKHTAQNGKKYIKNYLSSFDLPERFVLKILELSHIPAPTNLSQINKTQRKSLALWLTHAKFSVSHLGGWNMAMTTRGGVDLKEMNRKTMESKIRPGLYILGETLDIDGDTGGYNLQSVFSTAWAAAKHFCAMP